MDIDPNRNLTVPNRRLQHLYDLSQILARTEGMDDTVGAVLAWLARALDLRFASVVHATTGASASWTWPSGDASANQEPAGSPASVAIPLVVPGRSATGLVRIEGAAPFNDMDLEFLTSVASQLAVGLDRIVARGRDRERTVRAEEKQHEAEASRARYEGLVDSLDQIFVWEADLHLERVTYVSAQIEVVLGVAPSEWTRAPGRLIQSVLREDRPILLAAVARLPTRGIDQRCAHRCIARDGSIRWLHTGLHLAAASQPPLVQAVSVDITATRLMKADLEASVRARSHLVEIVTHDLRNPLHALMMSAVVLQKLVAADGTDAMVRMVDVVWGSAHRMSRLIDDLSDFAEVQAGQIDLELRPEAPRSLVLEAVAHMGPITGVRNQTLTDEVSADLPKVWCDRDRVERVLANLLGNASDCTPEGGAIGLSAASRGADVAFSVIDAGPGVPTEDLAWVSEKEARVGSEGFRGSDLRLAIAQGLVLAHGGRIWAESVLGAGTTFSFSIPCAAERMRT